MPAVRQIPETTIRFDPETGIYSFSVHYAGKRPHREMDVFVSLNGALAWCDPHRECIWEDTSDADESRIMVSRDRTSRGR